MSATILAAPSTGTTVSAVLDRVNRLVFAGLGLSLVLGAVAAVIAVSGHHLDQLVYIRAGGSLVASGVLFFFVAKTRAGKRWAYTRLRIIAIVAPIGLVATALLPGPYPLWVRIEQALHAAVVIAIAVSMFNPALKAAFPKQPK